MFTEVRATLIAAGFLIVASAAADPKAFVDRGIDLPAAPVLAFASSYANRGYVDLKPRPHGNSGKAVFITFTDPWSGFTTSGIKLGALGSAAGHDGEFLFDATNLLSAAGGSAIYLGTVNPERPLISITLGANSALLDDSKASAMAPRQVPSDPTALLILGLGLAALSLVRRGR